MSTDFTAIHPDTAVSPDFAICSGRPVSETGRLPREILVYDFLDKLSIPYERVDHAPANTIEACRDIDQALQVNMCKNLFLCNAQASNFYLLLLPGDKKFRTSVFSKQMGCSRLSFADAAHMEEFLSISPGSVSVLGLMNDKEHRVKLAIDRELLHAPFLGCHPCVNTSSLKIKTADILEKFLPAVEHDFTVVDLP